jgi:hypothetical protein
LTGAFKNFESVGSNLKTITEKGGGLDVAITNARDALTNVKNITVQLQKDNNLEKTLANFKAASIQLKIILDSLDKTTNSVFPKLDLIMGDLSQLAARLKQQPWRIVWPSTIKYPQDQRGTERPRVPLKRRH